MLRLTVEEQEMLAGAQGDPLRKAMEIVVALGRIYGAEDLVPVSHVQIAGVSYKNLGDAGVAFLWEWADQGARVRVPTTLNPAGMDMAQWRDLGIPADFAREQIRVVEAYAAMGAEQTLTCAPYLVGYRPALGEHIAWSESSAVSYANSVLGARTNREGGPSALAAAITGRTARWGLHLDAARLAHQRVVVRCSLRDETDFGALGYLVGRQVRNGVPYFVFEGDIPDLSSEERASSLLRALGAAMAASGAVALYHVEGVTPEARRGRALAADAAPLVVDDLAPAYAALNHPVEHIDLVSIGCPHASLAEIIEIAELLRGKKLRTRLWLTTARQTREQAEREGWAQLITEAGGALVADTCMVVAPVELLDIKSMATNSAKAAFYAPSHDGVQVRFGSLEQCLQAAITGRWSG